MRVTSVIEYPGGGVQFKMRCDLITTTISGPVPGVDEIPKKDIEMLLEGIRRQFLNSLFNENLNT